MNRASLFLGSLLGTIVITRLFLLVSPSTNVYLFGYNVHHLFTGAFLLIIAIILFLFDLINTKTILLAGISSGLILDEIVFLVATDGSDAAYLSTVSFWGMVVFVAITLLITVLVYNSKKIITRTT